jgi:hypothetical protein
MKAILNLGTVVWQQSNIVQQGVFCFQTSFGYKENFMQCREKSIFCMQYVCNVHCNYVVAHAYNTIAKIQSSSGWALLYVLRSLRLAQDFGNILASSCCTGSFSGMTTISSKWYTLQKKGMCIIISFFYFYAIFLTSCQKCVQSQSGKMYLTLMFESIKHCQNFWTRIKFKRRFRNEYHSFPFYTSWHFQLVNCMSRVLLTD